MVCARCLTPSDSTSRRRPFSANGGAFVSGEVAAVRDTIQRPFRYLLGLPTPESLQQGDTISDITGACDVGSASFDPAHLDSGLESFARRTEQSSLPGLKTRPCVILGPGEQGNPLRPRICLMATFDGCKDDELSTLARYFAVPVFPNVPDDGSLHLHSCPEWHDPQRDEDGRIHRQWIIALDSDAQRDVHAQTWGETPTGRYYVFERSQLKDLEALCEAKRNQWKLDVQHNPDLLRQAISELEVCHDHRHGAQSCSLRTYSIILHSRILALPHPALGFRYNHPQCRTRSV
jgi:hypothetical protein